MKKILLLLLASFSYAYEFLNNLSELPVTTQGSTIYVFDIDHTLLEPYSFIGSEAWFKQLMSKSTDFDQDIALYNLVQLVTPMTVTESGLSNLVNGLHAQNHTVFFITSRGPAIQAVTEEQLRNNALSATSSKDYCSMSAQHGVCRHNTYFTAGGNKGLALLEMLEQFPDFKKSHVIFIDDQAKHLESVSQALSRLGVSSQVYHYTQSIDKFSAMESQSLEQSFLKLFNKINNAGELYEDDIS